jgi:hypothetical protein
LKLPVFLLATGFAACAAAQEIVTLQTRPGVTQSFYLPDAGRRPPQALALLFVGGNGNIQLRGVGKDIRFAAGHFLARMRGEFTRNRVLPVLLDVPSDQQAKGIDDEFRRGPQHAVDVRAVLAELKKRYPGLPVFLVGGTKGTISVANLAAQLDREVAGAVFASALFYDAGRPPPPLLLSFNFAALRVPVLLVHHVADDCPFSFYEEAQRLSQRYGFPLIGVKGGHPPKGRPCEFLTPHGFYGQEARTADAIAGWMLHKPFAREVQ